MQPSKAQVLRTLSFVSILLLPVVFAHAAAGPVTSEDIEEQTVAPSHSAQPVDQPATHPIVGRKAAEKYFKADKKQRAQASDDSDSGQNPVNHVLMLHYGQYINSTAYSWGSIDPQTGAGTSTYGLTYEMEEWHGFDLNFRGDFSNYNISGSNAQKISILPMLTFPRAESRFPLYFGAGAGLGIFLAQLSNKSALTLDYELVVGARAMDLYKGIGAFIELGMKNHFSLLSTGQFIGTAFSVGAIFNF